MQSPYANKETIDMAKVDRVLVAGSWQEIKKGSLEPVPDVLFTRLGAPVSLHKFVLRSGGVEVLVVSDAIVGWSATTTPRPTPAIPTATGYEDWEPTAEVPEPVLHPGVVDQRQGT